MDNRQPANLIDASGAVDKNDQNVTDWSQDQKKAWNAIANSWNEEHTPSLDGRPDDGNDMFTQCLLPEVDDLADWQEGETVLDLGSGSGIIARRFAKKGARVVGLDFSEAMLDKGRERAQQDQLGTVIEYDVIDLMDYEGMMDYMRNRKDKLVQEGKDEQEASSEAKFDIITISTTLKSLPDLKPIAQALPHMLKPKGRIVIVDLHPVLSKPAGHRAMEIFEDPRTGKQHLSTYIKVPQYLNIEPVRSEAVRGQPEPLWFFHRPLYSLLQPFFDRNLVLDSMREPAFKGEPDLAHAQSYHNFQQTPMLLAFRLVHRTPPLETISMT